MTPSELSRFHEWLKGSSVGKNDRSACKRLLDALKPEEGLVVILHHPDAVAKRLKVGAGTRRVYAHGARRAIEQYQAWLGNQEAAAEKYKAELDERVEKAKAKVAAAARPMAKHWTADAGEMTKWKALVPTSIYAPSWKDINGMVGQMELATDSHPHLHADHWLDPVRERVRSRIAALKADLAEAEDVLKRLE